MFLVMMCCIIGLVFIRNMQNKMNYVNIVNKNIFD